MKLSFSTCQSMVKYFSQIVLVAYSKMTNRSRVTWKIPLRHLKRIFSLFVMFILSRFSSVVCICFHASPKFKNFWPWMNGFWKSKYSTIQILRNHPQKKILSLWSNHRLQALMILHFRGKSTEGKPAKELSKHDCTSPIWAIVGNLHGISVTRWVKLWKNATNFLLRSFDPWYKIMHTLKSYLLFMKWL